MTQAGRIVVLVGAALVVIGLAVWALGKAGFRGLPGDITYESERVRIYIPIVTCLAISVLLTLVLWLVRWLTR